MYEKDYVLKCSTCACEIDKYLKSIISDSEVTCDESIGAVAKLNKVKQLNKFQWR